MTIGVLALQGAFIEHERMLRALRTQCFEIRQKRDLERQMDALIIPGGESTVMGKLMTDLGLTEPVKAKISDGLPVLGTCAGLILLAKRIENDAAVHLGTMDICAKRNAYGRQLGSFETVGAFADRGKIPMVFIRAPYITDCGANVKILAECEGKIVAARQGNQLVTAFHPELTDDLTIHRYFIDEVCVKR